jgi:hypothetical protein
MLTLLIQLVNHTNVKFQTICFIAIVPKQILEPSLSLRIDAGVSRVYMFTNVMREGREVQESFESALGLASSHAR